MHIMSNIDGIDISQLEEKTMRSGAYSTLVPAVREKVRLSVQGPRSAGEWSRARDVCQDRARLKSGSVSFHLVGVGLGLAISCHARHLQPGFTLVL